MPIKMGSVRCAGALLGLLWLSGCNAGGAEEGLMESSTQEASSLSQASEGAAEPLVCICGATRYNLAANSLGFRCTQAEQRARLSLESQAAATCPTGYCNVVETFGPCVREPDGRYRGAVHWAISCCQ
ncbi:hypothetical protein [Myxococcus stipitatus]|uniref:hypothetical protein n=1 Tax=Myxococcus stipitatus TaxID=83455 RepID=UPI0030CA87C1